MTKRKWSRRAANDRRAAAVLLAENGPLPGDEAARRLGWSMSRWWSVIHRSEDWFALSGAGWVLTDIGRIESEKEEP